jgi:hypothetical protein
MPAWSMYLALQPDCAVGMPLVDGRARLVDEEAQLYRSSRRLKYPQQ